MPIPEFLDVVGVGFGPSNLGVAIALCEHNASNPDRPELTAFFAERQAEFGWHRGMLLEDATLQVSYLKDLVTLRDPRSAYSFLSYLHDRGRLVDFINYGSSTPTRREFHDYLVWAANRLDLAASEVTVSYGTEVREIVPVRDGGPVELLEVVVRAADGGVRRVRTRNVALACGLAPALPRGVVAGDRVWHSSELLHRSVGLADRAPTRFVVVGAGQSAAETVEHLHRTFPTAQVHAVFARYGYSPADDTSFANRIFDPTAVDQFYAAPDRVKDMLLGYHANTNYSVVDTDLIDGLYRTHYHERVAGTERLRFHNVSVVADVVELADHVEIVVESLIDGSREVLAADAVVYATGYRATDPLELLGGGLPVACLRDGAGRLDVRRDYRIDTAELADGTPVHAGIYVMGPTEHTHGITSTLLSNIAVRSGEIVTALAAGRTHGAPHSTAPHSTAPFGTRG